MKIRGINTNLQTENQHRIKLEMVKLPTTNTFCFGTGKTFCAQIDPNRPFTDKLFSNLNIKPKTMSTTNGRNYMTKNWKAKLSEYELDSNGAIRITKEYGHGDLILSKGERYKFKFNAAQGKTILDTELTGAMNPTGKEGSRLCVKFTVETQTERKNMIAQFMSEKGVNDFIMRADSVR